MRHESNAVFLHFARLKTTTTTLSSKHRHITRLFFVFVVVVVVFLWGVCFKWFGLLRVGHMLQLLQHFRPSNAVANKWLRQIGREREREREGEWEREREGEKKKGGGHSMSKFMSNLKLSGRNMVNNPGQYHGTDPNDCEPLYGWPYKAYDDFPLVFKREIWTPVICEISYERESHDCVIGVCFNDTRWLGAVECLTIKLRYFAYLLDLYLILCKSMYFLMNSNNNTLY